jgi:very-short-patch-repair endonuclease
MPSELDRRVEELASEQSDHFSVRQVLLLGGNPSHIDHRVGTGRWQRVQRGVLRLPGAPVTFETRLMANLLVAPDFAAASHRSASAIFGVPGFGAFVEISVETRQVVRLPQVTVHRSNWLPEHHVRTVRGIRTTSIARTLFDLSAVIRPERLERAIDNSLAKGMVTVPALSTMSRALAARGRRKLSVVREILAARGGNYIPPASELEAQFRDLLTRFGLPQADRQVNLGNGDSWLGRVDFLFRAAHVIVEVDGNEFHSALLDRRADAERDRSMFGAGWTVVRFGWDDVTGDPTRVAQALRESLGNRR